MFENTIQPELSCIFDAKTGEFLIKKEAFPQHFLALKEIYLGDQCERYEEVLEVLAVMIYLAALMDIDGQAEQLYLRIEKPRYPSDLEIVLIQILDYKLKQEEQIRKLWTAKEMQKVIYILGIGSPFGSLRRLSQRYLPAVWQVIKEALAMAEVDSIKVPENAERLDYVLKRLATDELDYYADVQKIYNELIWGCELKLSGHDLTLGKVIHGVQAMWFLIDENLGVYSASELGYVVQVETVEHYHLALSALFILLMAVRSEESIISELAKVENRDFFNILIELRAEIRTRASQYSNCHGSDIWASSWEAYPPQLPCDDRLFLIIKWSRQFLELSLFTLDSLIAVSGGERVLLNYKSTALAQPSKRIPEAEPGFLVAASHFEDLVKPEYSQLSGFLPPGRVDSTLDKICCCATD